MQEGVLPLCQDSTICVSTCVLSLKSVQNHEVNGIPLDVLPLYSAQTEHPDMMAMQNRLTQFLPNV